MLPRRDGRFESSPPPEPPKKTRSTPPPLPPQTQNGIDIAELVRDALAHLDADGGSTHPFALPPPPPAALTSPPPRVLSSRPPPAMFTSPPPPDSTGAVELPAPPAPAVRLREALAYSAPPPPKKRRRPRGRRLALLCTALGVLAAVTTFFGTSSEARTALLKGVTSTLAQAQGAAAGPTKPAADLALPLVAEPPVLQAVAWQPSGANRVWGTRVESPSITRAAQPAEPQAAAKPQALPQPAPRPAPPPPVALAAKPTRAPVASAPATPPARSAARPAAAPPKGASEDDAAALEIARQAKANLEGAL
jgi:hypothetical protein